MLAAVGILGALPPAVASASPQQALGWTEQAPAVSPSARAWPSMAYDAATGTVVLFGGWDGTSRVSDTWTWNGATWTKQAPAVHPFARFGGAMAYDAATGTVVLFGGYGYGKADIFFGDTWTWNGTTWTEQHPATSPPGRWGAAMAYDAATGTVVLFGGNGQRGYLGDTWTWDGTTWTEQAPATSPTARADGAMAYDAATGTAVLFGGVGRGAAGVGHPAEPNVYDAGTWTWDGTTWTNQAPATSPPTRTFAYMTYDAATGTAVLFGGYDQAGCLFGDTWTWDGRTWTKQAPATSPRARAEGAMAYDAATGTAVLFGGYDQTGGCARRPQYLAQTWTWG